MPRKGLTDEEIHTKKTIQSTNTILSHTRNNAKIQKYIMSYDDRLDPFAGEAARCAACFECCILITSAAAASSVV